MPTNYVLTNQKSEDVWMLFPINWNGAIIKDCQRRSEPLEEVHICCIGRFVWHQLCSRKIQVSRRQIECLHVDGMLISRLFYCVAGSTIWCVNIVQRQAHTEMSRNRQTKDSGRCWWYWIRWPTRDRQQKQWVQGQMCDKTGVNSPIAFRSMTIIVRRFCIWADC